MRPSYLAGTLSTHCDSVRRTSVCNLSSKGLSSRDDRGKRISYKANVRRRPLHRLALVSSDSLGFLLQRAYTRKLDLPVRQVSGDPQLQTPLCGAGNAHSAGKGLMLRAEGCACSNLKTFFPVQGMARSPSALEVFGRPSPCRRNQLYDRIELDDGRQ